MKYEQIKGYSEGKFRRLTGVKKKTFERCVEILKEGEKIKKAKGGRNNKLRIEDQMLLTLEYLREYRTYFHIGGNYGVAESTAFKTIRWVEDTLIKHPDLALPGRKALEGKEHEVVLIDATETPIERPKKNKGSTTLAKKSGIR